jgi:hypothetical protein
VGKTEGGKLRARKPRRPFMARSSVRKPRGTTLRQDPKLQSLLRDSVDEIARRSRGAANGPRQGQCAQLRKIDNFLPSRPGRWYCFSERPMSGARTPHGRRATLASASRVDSDSGMAPQTIEIAHNGLGRPHRAGNHPRRSGGTASLASASSASSTPIGACALEPRRRTDTVFSLASLRPRAMRTGTFANECSRTL